MIAVTKLLNLLNKPALKYWANKIGLEGVNIRNYESKVQTEGNIGHNDIEEFVNNGILFNGWEKFNKSVKDFNIIGCEIDVNNDYLCGRVDMILEKEGKKYIVDFKRNDKIYLETKIQLSTYKHIEDADYICYMNLESLELKVLNINTLKYYEIIKRLYQINSLLNDLNERL